MIDYVYSRPQGEPKQEIGGCFITLFSVASSLEINADNAFNDELDRINTPEIMEKIRKRQAEKRQITGITNE